MDLVATAASARSRGGEVLEATASVKANRSEPAPVLRVCVPVDGLGLFDSRARTPTAQCAAGDRSLTAVPCARPSPYSSASARQVQGPDLPRWLVLAVCCLVGHTAQPLGAGDVLERSGSSLVATAPYYTALAQALVGSSLRVR